MVHVDTQLELVATKVARISAQVLKPPPPALTVSNISLICLNAMGPPAPAITPSTVRKRSASDRVNNNLIEAFLTIQKKMRGGPSAMSAKVLTASSMPTMPLSFLLTDITQCVPIVTAVIESGHIILFEAAKAIVTKFGDISQRRPNLLSSTTRVNSTAPIAPATATAARAHAHYNSTPTQATLDGSFLTPKPARAASTAKETSKAFES